MKRSTDLLRLLRDASEYRLERTDIPKAIEKARAAALRLQDAQGLRTFVLRAGDRPPRYELGEFFKYSNTWGGSLAQALDEIKRGQGKVVVGVLSEQKLVGYGIGHPRKPRGTSIEIIDVSYPRRRLSGVSAAFKVGSEEFTVGIGHVVVELLINHAPRPLHTNATHESSSYVFKSLGFVQEPGSDNPCLLYLP